MSVSQAEFAEVYNDIGAYPTNGDVARQLGISEKTVRNKSATMREKHKKNSAVPKLVVRSALRGSASDKLTEEEQFLAEQCAENGVPIDDVSYYWAKMDGVSAMVRRAGAPTYEDQRDDIIAEMQAHAPVYKAIKHVKGEHLLVIDPADVHIGKLSRIFETGYDYDMKLAVERMREGVSGLLSKAQAFGGVERVVFVIGNDILHIDKPHRTTTSGTPQDTDGMWWESYMEAKKVYIEMLELCAQVAPVHVVFCPSNHDYVSGYMLADTISSWFHKHPHITFGDKGRQVSIVHRKYVEYGANLIGFTHGDGAKEKDLPNLLQYEAREAWGKAKFSYLYVHHTHHKQRMVYGQAPQRLEKDLIGFTVLRTGEPVDPSKNVYVETVRTPSPEDGWHDRNGYVNMQAIECFLHHPSHGQVARFSHTF